MKSHRPHGRKYGGQTRKSNIETQIEEHKGNTNTERHECPPGMRTTEYKEIKKKPSTVKKHDRHETEGVCIYQRISQPSLCVGTTRL
jgi:hypothetical protein